MMTQILLNDLTLQMDLCSKMEAAIWEMEKEQVFILFTLENSIFILFLIFFYCSKVYTYICIEDRKSVV